MVFLGKDAPPPCKVQLATTDPGVSINNNYAGLNEWGYCDGQAATTTPQTTGIWLHQAVNLPRQSLPNNY